MKAGLIAAAFGALVAAGQGKDAPREPLTLHVIDSTGVPLVTLQRASRLARGFFQNAGIATTWLICPSSHGQSDCELPEANNHLMVRVTHRNADKSRRAFGSAIKPPDNTGVYATIFYDRVANAAAASEFAPSLWLACVMAHEVGELLGLSHAPSGIMHATFDAADMKRASQGRLVFAGSQSREMEFAVAQRSKARTLMVAGLADKVKHGAGDMVTGPAEHR